MDSDLEPGKTLVHVKGNAAHGPFDGVFLEKLERQNLARVRSHHNGGVYLVPLASVEIAKKFHAPKKSRAKSLKKG